MTLHAWYVALILVMMLLSRLYTRVALDCVKQAAQTRCVPLAAGRMFEQSRPSPVEMRGSDKPAQDGAFSIIALITCTWKSSAICFDVIVSDLYQGTGRTT